MGSSWKVQSTYVTFFLLFFFFLLFWATPVANASYQARGQIRAIAAGLHHRHSNTGFEPRLQTTPEIMAMPDS